MNILDLTPNQLKRAASIKEQIDKLNKELVKILGVPAAAPTRNGPMSASVKKKIAAAQKTRWAKLRRSKSAAVAAGSAAKKRTFSKATRAKLSAKLKAFWAAKKKTGKK